MTFSIANIGGMVKDCERKLIKACIATVNIQAADTRRNAINEIRTKLTLRNSWTERNIVFTQCPQSVKDISQIQSEVGGTERAPYLERQEKGGSRKPESGSRLAIPSTNARGGTNEKTVRKRFILSTMGIVKGSVQNKAASATHKSRTVAKAIVASQNNLLVSENKTLFSISNFRKNGDSISFKKTPLYNVKFSQTETPASPWLEPSTVQPINQAQDIFNYQADKIFIES